MRNGRFHPFKKLGLLYTHSPKMPSPSPKIKKIEKKGATSEQPAVYWTVGCVQQTTASCQPTPVVRSEVNNQRSPASLAQVP
jgi:hypothetical protein